MADSSKNKHENIIDEAVQQFVNARLQDQEPNLDEFVKKYPGYEDQIRQKIEKIQRIDGLFSGLMQADDSDYGEPVDGHDLIGQTLGDFEIVSLIGAGGMGAVFLARQISLDREVALKVISDITGARGKSLERFKREAKVLAKISHPNIVPVYEVGEQGPYSYFVMEHVQGISLDKILASIRNAPPGEKASNIMGKCLKAQTGIYDERSGDVEGQRGAEIDTVYIIKISKMIVSIASALEYAHSKSILHRDVKPSNILIGSDGTAKLVDFGLAKAETQQTITMTGEFFGTPSYVSPEQIRKPEAVDCRSDVYSLAATYYECLTLHVPFEGDTVNETLTRVISKDAIPPKKYCPRLSTDLNVVLLHALEKAPEDRYQSASDFSDDIQNVLDFKPITAKRPSITRRTFRTLRRNPLKVTLALVIVVVVTLSFFVYSAYEQRMEVQRTAKVQQLLEDADVLLCQAALDYGGWPRLGVEAIIERACERYDQVLQIDEDNWWALIQNGIALLVNGERAEEALANFEKAETIKPDFAALEYLKSKALGQLGKGTPKQVDMDNLSSLNSREAYILGMLSMHDRTDWDMLGWYTEQAGQEIKKPKNEQNALALFNISVEKEPDFFPGLVAKAFANKGRGKHNIEECRTLASIKPNAAICYILAGITLNSPTPSLSYQGEPEKALLEYQKVVELQPWNPQSHGSIGPLYEMLGLKEEAKKHLLRACEIDKSSWSYLSLARFYLYSEKDYHKALDACEKAFEKRYNFFIQQHLLNIKIECLEKIGTTQELQESLELKENYLRKFITDEIPRAQYTGGHVCPEDDLLDFLYSNGRKTEAREFYEEITKTKPELKIFLGGKIVSFYESDGNTKDLLALCQLLYEEIKNSGFYTKDVYDRVDIVRTLAYQKLSSGASKDEVDAIWTDLLAIYPNVAELWSAYGDYLMGVEDFEGSIEAHRQACRNANEEQSFRMQDSLAMVLPLCGKYEEAEKELRALDHKLDGMELHRETKEIGESRYGIDFTTEDTAESIYIRLSDACYNQGKTADALAALEKGLKRLPESYKLYGKIALMRDINGEKEKAIEAFIQYFDHLPTTLTKESTVKLIWSHFDFWNMVDAVNSLTLLFLGEGRVDEAQDFIIREQNLKRQLSPLSDPNLERSLNKYPRYETALSLAQAQIYLAKRNFIQGFNELYKVIEMQPELVHAWVTLGTVYKLQGDYEKAVQIFERVIATDSNDIGSLNGLAYLYSTCPKDKYRNGKRAVELALKLIELTGYDNPLSLGTLAAAYAECGDFDKAVEYQQKAIKLGGDDSFVGVGTKILMANGSPTVTSVIPGTPASTSGLIAGDIIEAVDDLSTTDMPINDIVNRLSGQEGTEVTLTVRHPGKNTREKVKIIRKMIRPALARLEAYKAKKPWRDEIVPDYAIDHLVLGLRYKDLGRHEEAIEAYKQAIRIKPDYVDAHIWLGNAYSDLARYEEAVSAYQQAINIKPDNASAYFYFGASLHKSGRHKEAIKLLKQAVTIEPYNTAFYGCLGSIYSSLNSFDDAIAAYSKAVEIDPNKAAIYSSFGDIYVKAGRKQEAIKAFNHALKIDSNDVGSLNGLAWLYSTCPKDNHRDGKKAVELALRMIELTGYDDPYSLDTLAAAYAECGDFDKAIEYQEKAFELADDSIRAECEKRLEAYKANKPWRE